MRPSVLIGLCILWIFSLNGFSREFEGLTISDSEILGEETLPLHGIGVRKATLLGIKIYMIAFYYPIKLVSADELLAKPKNFVIRLKFLRDVSREKIVDAFRSGFQKNSVDLKNFSSSWKLLDQILRNFTKQDELTFIFHNNKLLIKTSSHEVSIDQIEFIPQLLKLWFGTPPNEDLKKGLLAL